MDYSFSKKKFCGLEYVYDFTTGNGESPEGLVTLVLCEAK
jgi:hypothetical protein